MNSSYISEMKKNATNRNLNISTNSAIQDQSVNEGNNNGLK
jgi:hypothetical protein